MSKKKNMENLIKARKRNLKPTKTILTNSLGEKYEIDDSGMKKIDDNCLSFVVDNKPDLNVVEIITGLYLSSQDPIYSIEILGKFGIKNILSLGIEPEIKFPGISYHFIEILDVPEFNFVDFFDKCFNIIDDCRKENILVHCNAGVSRSPTIIIAYLMKYENFDFRGAYDKVKNARSCIKPNDGFIKQLKTFDTKK